MKKKILLVDDNKGFVEILKMRLEASKYSVVITSDAKEVLPLAEKGKPDIIILDIVMPDMNGYEVCEALKHGKTTSHIPIILLSGKDLEPKGIDQRCYKLGIEHFFTKPPDTNELLAKIKDLVSDK
ncbi:MAG: response regulator [Candidatus Omnitrophota bacterium]